MLSGIYTPEMEETGEVPLVETVENVMEMARIFSVDIRNEPYLVHVLQRALRHYANVVREKRKVKDVEDFWNMILRYKDIVAQFEQSSREEEKLMRQKQKCVQCEDTRAVLFCDQCKDYFCQGCYDRLHARGRR